MPRATDRAVAALSERLATAIDRAIRTVVAHRGPALTAAAEAIRAEHPGVEPGRLVQTAARRRAWHLAGTGAVSSLPAVLPGPGTMAEVGAALADVTLLTAAQVELILVAAHLYDRPLDDEDARLLDVLLVLGIDVGAVKLRRGGGIEALGETYAAADLHGVREDALARRVSARLAVQVTARLARRRAHIILGREIPVLGIGLAAGFNLRSTRALGNTAVRFFRHVA
jgi:uncharacterized protein (DUF697 family)